MTKNYKKLDLIAGSTIENAVAVLLQHRAQNQLVSAEFNGVILYSDTVTMDDAYMQIMGHTKAEQDAYLEEFHARHAAAAAAHEARIPELTAHWIAEGNKILAEDKRAEWAQIVPYRLQDLYKGMELGCTLDIVKVLNADGTFEEAKAVIESQDHSGMSFGLVCSMVREFAVRGADFVEFVR